MKAAEVDSRHIEPPIERIRPGSGGVLNTCPNHEAVFSVTLYYPSLGSVALFLFECGTLAGYGLG